MIPVHNQKNSTTYRTKSIFETSLFLTPETVKGKWADQSFWPNNFWDHVGGISQWYSRQPLAIHFSNARSTHTIPEIFTLKVYTHSSCSFWSGEFSVIFQHWPRSLPSFNLSLIWFNIWVIMKKSRKMWNYLVIYHLQKKATKT